MATPFMTRGVSRFFNVSAPFVQQNMQQVQQLTSKSVLSNAEALSDTEDEQSKNIMQQMISLASAANPIASIASTVLSFFDFIFGDD